MNNPSLSIHDGVLTITVDSWVRNVFINALTTVSRERINGNTWQLKLFGGDPLFPMIVLNYDDWELLEEHRHQIVAEGKRIALKVKLHMNNPMEDTHD